MRLLALFLRSRRAGTTGAVMAGAAAVGWAWGWSLLRMQPADPTYLTLAVPLCLATVIGASTYSPLAELERGASRPLAPLRAILIALLLVLGVGLFLLAGIGWSTSDIESVLLRNLAGFVGLSLLGAPIVGAWFTWVTPLAYGALALEMGATPSGAIGRWAWPVQPSHDHLALGIALALLAGGILATALWGARYSRGDT